MSLNIINEDDSKKLREEINELRNMSGEEYDFCDELIKEIGIEELESDALYYQLDMFINACNMFILKGGYSGLREGSKGYKCVYKDHVDEKIKYHFEITRNKSIMDDSLGFSGTYNDLEFSFDNYYKTRKIGNDIWSIPFVMQLRKEIGNKTYSIIIGTLNGKTQYNLTQIIDTSKEQIFKHVDFYSKRDDLESSYDIIHAFAEDPERLFNTYEERMHYKTVYFNRKEIDLIQNDDLLMTNKGKTLVKKSKN